MSLDSVMELMFCYVYVVSFSCCCSVIFMFIHKTKVI
ncbi:unnamed protein product, partial [Brassica oleracea var. botrytis]